MSRKLIFVLLFLSPAWATNVVKDNFRVRRVLDTNAVLYADTLNKKIYTPKVETDTLKSRSIDSIIYCDANLMPYINGTYSIGAYYYQWYSARIQHVLSYTVRATDTIACPLAKFDHVGNYSAGYSIVFDTTAYIDKLKTSLVSKVLKTGADSIVKACDTLQDISYLPLHGKADSTVLADSCSGGAVRAAKLTTARSIGGVSFDGTANIVPDTCTGSVYTDTALWADTTPIAGHAVEADHADSADNAHRADTSTNCHKADTSATCKIADTCLHHPDSIRAAHLADSAVLSGYSSITRSPSRIITYSGGLITSDSVVGFTKYNYTNSAIYRMINSYVATINAVPFSWTVYRSSTLAIDSIKRTP